MLVQTHSPLSLPLELHSLGVDIELYHSRAESDLLSCIHSTKNPHKIGTHTYMYEIQSLMRVLSLKLNLVDNKDQFLNRPLDKKEICYVLNWSPFQKEAMIFSMKSDFQKIDQLSRILNQKNELNSFFYQCLRGRK